MPSVRATRRWLVLAIEKLSQRVEFGLAPVGEATALRRRHALADLGDDGLGIRRPPRLRALLDGFEIGHEIGTLADQLPDVLRRLLLAFLTGVVRRQELFVGGDDVAAHRRLLITQGRLQRIGLHPCRLDVVDQVARQLVGAVHQQTACDEAHEHDHTHGGQQQVLPTLNGERSPRLVPGLRRGRGAVGHRAVRSTRTSAMSSVSPPWARARCAASPISASTNAGPGRSAW